MNSAEILSDAFQYLRRFSGLAADTNIPGSRNPLDFVSKSAIDSHMFSLKLRLRALRFEEQEVDLRLRAVTEGGARQKRLSEVFHNNHPKINNT